MVTKLSKKNRWKFYHRPIKYCYIYQPVHGLWCYYSPCCSGSGLQWWFWINTVMDHTLNCHWSCCSVLFYLSSDQFCLFAPYFLTHYWPVWSRPTSSCSVSFCRVPSCPDASCLVLVPLQSETPRAVPQDGGHTSPPVTCFPRRQTPGIMPNMTVRPKELIWLFSIMKQKRYFWAVLYKPSILYYPAATSFSNNNDWRFTISLPSQQAVVSTFGCSLEMWMGLRKRQDLLTCNWMLEDGSQLHYT